MAERVCPVWAGYLLSCPLRRFFENPDKILKGFIKPGMTVLDAGCAMGFFSLPSARMVGEEGRVVGVDLQPKMIDSLKKRALKKGLARRIDARVCCETSLVIDDLAHQVDFAYAIHVVHEVPDFDRFLKEIFEVLKAGSLFLLIEPQGHVSAEEYKTTVDTAINTGFKIVNHPNFKRNLSTVFEKP